jgi:3-oxoacyl-[acyl-carrier protein] reductase
MNLHLDNKVAIVTGGARGLGRAICLGLAAEGAKVIVNYCRNPAKAVEVVDRINREHDRSALAVHADVTCEDEVKRMFDTAQSDLGPIDILINNAGVRPSPTASSQMSRQHWDSTMAINMTGPFITCREAVTRWIAEKRGGRIVNVASPVAFRGTATGHADYGASKAALVNFTKSLALEVASAGIYVNGVAPGMMFTDMSVDDLKYDMQGYIDKTPLGRIADPAEIADTVVFIASSRASYMTGTTVNTTGGMVM